MKDKSYMKENVVPRPPVSFGWLVAAAAGTLAALAVATLADRALPEPLTRDSAPPDRFIAEIAHEHLVNLTAIGPRVAGSYENEVLGVGVIVAAVKHIAHVASPHARVELDVQIASGAFPLTFMDGMNHVYQGVSNVVARVSAAGGGARRGALLLNCHIDTVPDSPGASDDGAGCAVLLETLRVLATTRSPPRHDAIFLFNGAEENVLQASHGFITQHKWAKSVRAFINIEACGAGGREVLFQAGPHEPWIVEMYAGAVPHPFASSLAQELFESGLIPADTDFRIFRDFGKLSGVDLAWSSNGYVYHTALDTAERVSRAVLQRTGDNVLALARGMLASEALQAAAGDTQRQPVFFDVLGLVVVSARAPVALLAACAALALVALDAHLTAGCAARELLISRGAWWQAAWRGACVWACAGGAGLAAAGGVALALHAAGARLAFYSRPSLLAPLYAMPALASAWCVALALTPRALRGVLRVQRGWWAARALASGGAGCAAAVLAAAALAGLRSGFLPWLWAALPAGAGCLRHAAGQGARGAAGWWWAGGAVLPVLQTWYLALGSLRMLVPVAGRAPPAPVPPDVVIALLTATLVLSAFSWLLPLVVASRAPYKLIVLCVGSCAVACAYVVCGSAGAPYSVHTPQRLMVFHTRRTLHAPHARAPPLTEHFYWMPQLDVNAPHSLDMYAEEMRLAMPVTEEECALWPYCGVPYYLPVRGLVRASHRAPASAPPRARARATLALTDLNATHAELHVRIAAAGPAHTVVIVSPAVGARVAWSSAGAAPLRGARGAAPASDRDVYFFAVHHARPSDTNLTLLIHNERGGAGEDGGGRGAARGTQVSLAAHALFGADKMADAHAALVDALPPWATHSGWGVDLHLYQL